MNERVGEARSPFAMWRSAWPAFLLLAAGELLLALLASAPAISALRAGLGNRTILAELASPRWAVAVADFALAGGGAPRASGLVAGMAPALVGTILMSLFAVLAHGVLYTFASGAALVLMTGRTGGLWQGGRHWFWPLLRLGLWLVVATLLAGTIGAVAVNLLPGSGLVGAATRIAAWLALIGALGSLFELSRATMVARGERSALRGIGGALRALTAHPLAVLGVWLALGLGNVALALVVFALTTASSAAVPPSAWLVTLLAVALGTGYKLFRLSAQLSLVVSSTPMAAEPSLE